MARTEEPQPGTSEQRHAPVYVNDREVEIRATDPTVRDVVRKAGYDPARMDVYRLRDANDRKGTRIPPETILHLSKENEPVYLRCEPKADVGEPSILTSIVTSPSDDPRRGLGVQDMQAPPQGPSPMSPEGPGPPSL